ncbi:MAG: hypothetical protein R3F17_12460 [Planctomycetota bacterium]
MRAVLSQTGLPGLRTCTAAKTGACMPTSTATAGPKVGRLRALARIQAAGAVHIGAISTSPPWCSTGSRPSATALVLVVPAVQNDYYGRWWWPLDEQPGANATRRPCLGPATTATASATASPCTPTPTRIRGQWRGFRRGALPQSARLVTFECWPRSADVTQGKRAVPGWPRTVFPGRPR